MQPMRQPVQYCGLGTQELAGGQRDTIILKILRCSDPSTDHYANAPEVVDPLINKVIHMFASDLPPKLFQAQFILKHHAFAIVAPAPFVEIASAIASQPFKCETEGGIKYLLQIDASITVEAKTTRRTDSTNYLWITIPPTLTMTDKELDTHFAAVLIRHGLRVSSFQHGKDKVTGMLINRIRFGFDIMDAFRVHTLPDVYEVTIPGTGDIVKLQFSERFCSTYGIHRDCLKTLPSMTGSSTPLSGVCHCDRMASQKRQRAQTVAVRNAAQEAFRKRRMDRCKAIENDDTF